MRDLLVIVARRDALYTAFALYAVSRAIEAISVVEPYNLFFSCIALIVQVVALLILLLRCVLFLRKSENIKRVCAAVVTLIVLSIASNNGKSYLPLWVWLFVVSGSDAEIKPLAIIALVCSITTVVLGFAVTILGINIVDYAGMNFEARTRITLGLTHPNRLGQALLCMYLSYKAIYDDVIPQHIDVAVSLSLFAFGLIVDSRTACVGIIMIWMLFLIVKKISKSHFNLSVTITRLIVLVCVITSVILMVVYAPDNNILFQINQLLSYRIAYAHAIFEKVGVRLFGFDLSESAHYVNDQYAINLASVPLDNAYTNVLLSFGPLVLLLLIILSLRITASAKQERSYYPLAAIAACAVIGMSETYILDPAFNFLIITGFPMMKSHLSNDSLVRE